MADKKITDLPLRSAVINGLNFPSDDGVMSYRVTGAQIKSFVLATGNVITDTIADGAVTLSKLASVLQGAFVSPGTIISSAAIRTPSGYLACDGTAYSRTTYASLFSELTTSTTGTLTSGSATISAIPTTQWDELWIGSPISGTGIPSGATVLTKPSSGSITVSGNATATGAAVALLFAPFGLGDGSTTFNVPDLRGIFVRGSGTSANSVTTGKSGKLGVYENDAMQGHAHLSGARMENQSFSYGQANTGLSGSVIREGESSTTQPYSAISSSPYTNGTNGTPRTASETRPANTSVNYYIKT